MARPVRQEDRPRRAIRLACVWATAVAVLWLLAATASAQEQVEVPASEDPQDPIVSEQEAEEALADAEALLLEEPAAPTGEAAEPTRELTLVLREVALGVRQLDRGDRRRARAILARPTDAGDSDAYIVNEATPHCTPNFCIHYVTATRDRPDPTDTSPANGIPDYVERVGEAAEASFATENGTLGWVRPISDGSKGTGNGKTDIYLVDLGQGLFGYATTDPGQGLKRKQSAYLVIDNDYSPADFPSYSSPLEPMRVTIAHEYNHVLQFAYDVFQDAWLFESTATYIEDLVFPSINDYITGFVPEFTKAPQLPITDPETNKIYGSAVLHHYLASRFGHSLPRDIWASSTKGDPKDYSIAAADFALDKRGTSFSKQFAKFTPTTAEWRSNGIYADGTLYPDVKRAGKLSPGQRKKKRIDHTAYRLYDVPLGSARGSAKDDLKLSVKAKKKNKKKKTRSGVALVGRKGERNSGTVTTKVKFLKKGEGSVRLKDFRGFDRVTAVVTNADGRVDGFGAGDWNYKRDNIKYSVKLKTA